MTDHLLLGQTLQFSGDPLRTDWTEVSHHTASGGVLIQNGKVAKIGDASVLKADHPDAQVTDYGDALITAGFVDAHMHYPQTRMIASWGKQLIDWLNTYTFPEESRFGDRSYADAVAGDTLDLALAHQASIAAIKPLRSNTPPSSSAAIPSAPTQISRPQ